MINLYIDNHSYHYEMENLIRVFFPNEKINKIYTDEEDEDLIFEKPYVFTSVRDDICVRLVMNDFEQEMHDKKDSEDDEIVMACLLYDLLFRFTDVIQPWGILTGVRPVKLYDNIQKKTGPDMARDLFINRFRVSLEKFYLMYDVFRAEREIKSLSKPDSFSLYVSIPFCPSRCSYCSFISSSIDKTRHLVGDYMPLLYREIEESAKIAKDLGLKLLSVYIGGGTPTTLEASQLEELIKVIKNSFDMSTCREFTVEAGRPDTIDREKLEVLKNSGVIRISINPQTLSDDVLEQIGRKHTVQETLDAFALAREAGLDNINMDIIAGLKGDDLDNFMNTVDRIIELDPESVTVHTLALKSGSSTFMRGGKVAQEHSRLTKLMLDYAQRRLTHSRYVPYYLYRQSKMLGNLENVGYAKRGYESLYNVYVMEEIHTILACGAGAVTKLKQPGTNNLERIFNFKYPFEYIDRFDEMLERKKKIYEFYSTFEYKTSDRGGI